MVIAKQRVVRLHHSARHNPHTDSTLARQQSTVLLHAQSAADRNPGIWVHLLKAYLHLLVMVDVQEALPELDDLKGHKQGDGHQV